MSSFRLDNLAHTEIVNIEEDANEGDDDIVAIEQRPPHLLSLRQNLMNPKSLLVLKICTNLQS